MSGSQMERLFRDASRKGIPVEVMIELTHHCNFRCRHCYIPDFTVADGLTTERVLELLDELATMGTLQLALSGGELLLRRDWLEIARHARELGFDLHLCTNGSRLDEVDADAIAALPATVHVSLHTLGRERFQRLTGRDALAATLAGIEALRARSLRVILKTALTTLNRGDLDGLRAYAARIGAELRFEATISPRRDGDLSLLQLRLPTRELLPVFSGPESGCDTPAPGADDRPLCAAGTRYAVVTATGDVFPCNLLPLPAGNVLETSFREVWEGSQVLTELRGLRRRDLETCDTCPKIAYCGRCHARALLEDGNLRGPSRRACEQAAVIGEAAAKGA